MSTTIDIDPAKPAASEDRTVAILSYITPLLMGVGIVIAILIHNGKKTALGAYHLRQSLGLLLAAAVAWIAIGVMAALPLIQLLVLVIAPLLWLAFFVLWIMGLIAAINSQQKPLPLVGTYFEKWFANTF